MNVAVPRAERHKPGVLNCGEQKWRNLKGKDISGFNFKLITVILTFVEFRNDPSMTECFQVSDTINKFVENSEEDASYVLGKSRLTIQDGRLTYEP